MIDFDWSMFNEARVHGGLSALDVLMRLGAATVLGAAIGIERERRERAAGFRTHSLVCVAAALIMIVSTYGFPPDVQDSLDPSRIAAQVVSGVGFLGAGVIIFRKNTVRGLTTAASIWAVSGVGLAVGGGLYLAGAAGAAFMLLIQGGLSPIERKLFAHHSRRHRMLLTVPHSTIVFSEIQHIASSSPGFRLLSLDFDLDEASGNDVVELTLEVKHPDDMLKLIGQFRQVKGVTHLDWREGPPQVSRRNRRGVDLHDEEHDEEEGI